MSCEKEVIALVCARGGSKGIPRKNLRQFNGKPLVTWAVEIGLACSSVTRVVVSTDDEEIASVARRSGAEVPFLRPSHLARDDSSEWLVWRHAVGYLVETGVDVKTLVVLPPTAPLRAIQDVEDCISKLMIPDTDAVVTMTPARRNPYFNMVSPEKGYLKLAVPPAQPVVRRQDAPPFFDLTTVAYGVRPDYVLDSDHLFQGRVRGVVVPPERGIDIDTELDLSFGEFLARHPSGPGGLGNPHEALN